MNAQNFLSQAGRELCELDGTRAECLAQVQDIAHQELKRAPGWSNSAGIHNHGARGLNFKIL